MKISILFLIIFFMAPLSIEAKDIELTERDVLDGKISVVLPSEFTKLDQKTLDIKYPLKTAPREVYSDKTTAINFTIDTKDMGGPIPDNLSEKDFQDLLNVIKKGITLAYEDFKILDEGFVEINNKKYAYLKVIVPAVDTEIYNYMVFSPLNEKILVASFNTTIANRSVWEVTGDKMIESLKIKG